MKIDIDIHSMLCPMCSLQSEDYNQVFMKYEITNKIWGKVFKWLDLPFSLFNNVLELLVWIDLSRIKKKKKKMVEVICIMIIWDVMAISEQCHVSNVQDAEESYFLKYHYTFF